MHINYLFRKSLLLLFLFVTINSFSQINFENGYFINKDSIKTECLIRNIAWNANPTEFEYKLNENTPVTKATIADIKEFNVGNSYRYKRFKVNIDKSGAKLDKLSQNKSPEWEEETLFLNLLVEGEINLYKYYNGDIIRFFISTGKHVKAEQLVYKEYLNEFNNEMRENNQFRQQLLNTLKSDKLTTSDFEKINYNTKELVELFVKYNGSKNNLLINLQEKQNKSKLNLKINAGVYQTAFSFWNEYYDNSFDFNTKAVFMAGVELENVFSFNQKKWSAFIAPNYQSYKADGKTQSSYSERGFGQYLTFTTEYKSIEIPLGIRYYMFIGQKSRIFINAAFTIEYTFSSTLSYYDRNAFLSNQYLDITKQSFGGFTGIGYSNGTYGIELRYNLNRDLLSNYSLWHSDYKSFGIVASYRFL
jgi:hypothetical protein